MVVLLCAQSSAVSGSARIGRITIPADATPGQQIIVMTTVGVQFTVVVPNYAKPGQQMEIALPDGFGSVSEHAFVDARAGQIGAVTGGQGESLGGGVSSSLGNIALILECLMLPCVSRDTIFHAVL